jgi:hypothetical protein
VRLFLHDVAGAVPAGDDGEAYAPARALGSGAAVYATDGGDAPAAVLFEAPVALEPGTEYVVHALISSAHTCHSGHDGGLGAAGEPEAVGPDGVVFKFLDSPDFRLSGNGTSSR